MFMMVCEKKSISSVLCVLDVCVCVCECICPFFAHVYGKTSSVDLYQKPKTLQSVLVSLVLRLDESNKIDKFFKRKQEKKPLSQLVWNSVSLVSNSGQKGFAFYS